MKNILIFFLCYPIFSLQLMAEANLPSALRRVTYIFGQKMPSQEDFTTYASSLDQYKVGVRHLVNGQGFYDAVLRYHQRIFGVGLPVEYLDELLKTEIDGKQRKFSSIVCSSDSSDGRLRCSWSSVEASKAKKSCPASREEEASVFWYPGVVAWVCPTILQACGSDLSQCLIKYSNASIAEYSEMGVTEFFDSRYAVINSLSRQSAGLAATVVTENYPYSKILESGLTAIDGAIAHFYRQGHHFRLEDLRISDELLEITKNLSPSDSRFRLVKLSSELTDRAGVISTFGWLRRFDKNRTRANEIYERLMCRKFLLETPRVFPQDPGNLREAEGCSGCHAVLDPLADFYLQWGEGGEIYQNSYNPILTSFNGQSGSSVADLGNIVSSDPAFLTCTVDNVWQWLMGRQFYSSENSLRLGLVNYFVATKESFKELVYAISTHPAFLEAARGDGVVTDPIEAPPLGHFPEDAERTCDQALTYADDIQPYEYLCSQCHQSNTDRVDLTSETQWQLWGQQSVDLMSSGQMPQGQFKPEVLEFKEILRCWLQQES